MIHKLKCWPGPFLATSEGRKTHEVRRCDDRMFDEGDILCLEEYIPSAAERGDGSGQKKGHFTGQQVMVRVTYITSPETFGLPHGVCVMSVRRV